MEAVECVRNNIGNMRKSEENFEEIRSLSPIEEESESTLCINFSESEGNGYRMTRPPYKDYPRMLRKSEGDSSSGDERTEQDYHRLRRVAGSYCCFEPDAFKEAEASGDNDEAEIGLRDKSLKTTVEQLKRRLSQAEREIVALKRYQSPQKCQSHGRCEILQRDLLTWRDEHEKRISSQIVRWQLAERQRIHDEMGCMRKVYDNIERHLETLERRSAKSYFDFQRRIDAWEKRLKEDVISLHESNLIELREQFRAWSEMQSAINLSDVRKEKCEAYERDDTVVKKRDESHKSNCEMTASYENNAKLLRRIEHFVKIEVQRHRDDLIKRIDQKIAEFWSAFEDFKHNFHLDRDYRRHNYVEVNSDETESNITEGLCDSTRETRETSYLNTDSEERCAM
ncbi:PREDICTED: uncharacterized protein LOC105452875 isoform X2 [Wasmannia auropunctata]|uniref:uncharacterized protein LOC105452875 isoform X2 n=1 Tax=Wasmannia auropunctata TaxID=64793 RepID=UPI0005ED8A3D|nr:PREDICTED: uncharacterized protein LOC105452875 isoform X2 [Wasmannia auropunctata]